MYFCCCFVCYILKPQFLQRTRWQFLLATTSYQFFVFFSRSCWKNRKSFSFHPAVWFPSVKWELNSVCPPPLRRPSFSGPGVSRCWASSRDRSPSEMLPSGVWQLPSVSHPSSGHLSAPGSVYQRTGEDEPRLFNYWNPNSNRNDISSLFSTLFRSHTLRAALQKLE